MIECIHSVFLFQLQSVAERLADDLSHHAIGAKGGIDDDRAQLAQIHLAVDEDGRVRPGSHDLADQTAGRGVPALDLALQRQRVLFDDRGVDMRARMDVAARLLDLVDLFAGLHDEVIGDQHGVRCAESHGKRAGLFKVLGGL